MTASIESLVVEAMPADDRQLLRRGAVLRYITRPLAAVVTDSAQAAERLVEHPVVQGGVRGRTAELWTIPEPLRKALVAGWDAADEIRLRVAEAAAGLDALYARLAAAATRTAALTDLSADFAHALDAADVPRAHDLLRLLDEWPVADAAEARRTRDRLAPRLRRHSRALRDREATATYLERGFEDSLWEMLLADDGRWMLHLHAPGGRGKTMLVKNLLGRRCPAEDIPVARIDFDHVTQLGIATTEPWRLLLSIAAQLDPQLRDSPFGYMLALYGMFQNVTQPEALPRVAPVTAVAIGDHSDELAVDAAREVPSRFRKYLAAAVGDRPVIIALDTVENVLHTEGADLFPLLAAFSDIVHGTGGGGTGGDGVRVPGLRLIVSGRFDLAEERPVQAGRSRPRSPGFRSRWVGADSEIERYFPDGAEVLLGREVATLEMPAFTPAEAREFLTEQGGVTDPALVEAIVGRTHDNPMKLALIAEYVNRHPDVTAEAISAFEQIELYYLVERVVERIADERVQWLLRWGALLPVLTREAVEQVIWPALESLVRSGDSYDDTSQDPLPAPPDDVNRWPIPSAGAVGEPGAAGRAWETLLDYTAGSSWVSRVEELPDAVAFHPEIREPLRRLLRQGGNPVYDDIHRRAFAYWSGVVGQAQGATRAAALRAVLFHAYQPWQGADHAGDPLFHRLLADSIGDRAERAALAWEVLELSGGEVGPSAEVRSLAHLELAEATVDRANQHRTPVRESALSYHLGEVTDDVRAREPRRSEFLHAVLADSSGRVDECWAAMDRALGHPPADMHLPLVTAWIAPRTPPPGALDTVRRLLAETTGTPYAAPVAQALTDGLLAAERWIEARDLADLARSPDLRCACLLAVGDPDAVLADPAAAGIWRARARLLRFEPTAALLDLDLDTPTAGKASMRTPADLLVRGLAYGQLDRFEEATDALSQAASSQDTAVSIEASLALARYLGRLGRNQLASSHLRRLAGFADLLVVLRAKTTEAGLYGRDNPALGAALLLEAETLAATTATLRPSAAVELAIARLAVRGVTDEGLTGLRDALAAVQGAGPRLLALRGLADVDSPRMPVAAPVADELRRLTPLDGGTAALVLARAELDRVLGDERGAAGLLGRLTGGRAGDDDETLARTVADAGRRLASPPSLGGPDADGDGLTDAFERRLDLDPGHADTDGGSLSHAEEIVTLRLSTDPGGEMIWIEVDGAPDLPPVPLPPDIVNWGAADLVRSPAVILDRLREALLTPYVRDRLRGSETPRLHLLADAEAARWPWEVAVRGEAGVLRRQAGTPRITARPEPSRTVLVTIPNERKDRGHVADLVTSYYDGRATILPRLFPTSSPLPPGGGILHVVADPVQRRGLPGLQLPTGDLLTAESMARSLGDGPWLVILDLVLTADDYDAAEQLMIGNVFCWHLVRNAPDVDVLCGMFSAGDRIDSLRRLAGHLAAGEPLTTVGDDLQRARPALPGGRPPWRDFVSLSTDSPYRRYRLAEPA